MRSLVWAVPLSILLWIMILSPAYAGQWEVLVRAYHYDLVNMRQDTNYNDQAYGIGYSDQGYGLGIYHNSLRKTTVYAVKQFKINN